MLPPRRRIQGSPFLVTLAPCLLMIATSVHGFVRPLPGYMQMSSAYYSQSARLDKTPSKVHFDDFGDVLIGDEGSAPPDTLKELIREVKQDEVRKDAQLAKNWKTGNWRVRGFSLDKYDATQEESQTTVHVSKVHTSLTPNQVVVGRTDGSVLFVTLGTQYLTQFVGKLTAQETSNATIQIQSELVPSEDMMKESEEETPFQVERQFMAHESSIVALATAENLEQDQRLLFTAAHGNGDIRVWNLPEETNAKIVPLRTLTDAHADTVVALTTLSLSPDEDDNLLFSASKDGSIALFDFNTGDLVYKCQMVQDEEPCSIFCADVDQARTIIYLGMASGHVVGFNAQDMLECASEGGTCPIPSGRFMAHEGGVTSVNCAGEGTLARSNPGASSSVLLTGGSDGIVKQWEIMFRKMESTSPEEPSFKLEQWPRMANQRMQRRAHLFKGHGEMPVTALASMDASKFLSAGADGTVRAWSPSTGKELFRMDGFTEALSSLCLQEDLYLITDGMEHFVCVHDFDVEATEVEDGYELEW